MIINYIIIKFSLFLNWFFGGFDSFLYVLLVFLLFGYVFDLILAILKNKSILNIGCQGILKRSLILIFIGLGHILDLYIVIEGDSIRNGFIFFYLSNEAINLIKTANKLGLPVPQKLQEILNQKNNINK